MSQDPYPLSPISSYGEEDDHLHEECGVFGIYHHENASALCALGLHALQHRGQEAAGIAVHDGKQFHIHTAFGKVGDNFNSHEIINRLQGHSGIGHVRYSTSGGPNLRNVQPLYATLQLGGVALAHNGNLTNASTLRQKLINRGCIFQSTSDTENVIHLMAIGSSLSLTDRIIDALSQLEGGFSFIFLTSSSMIGVRDSLGIRPLLLGQLNNSYLLASESCALDIVGAKFVRDVAPGEMIIIEDQNYYSLYPFPKKSSRFCIFEYVYFSRPDSVVEGKPVYYVRKHIGIELAREAAIDADIVVPVPDSGVPAAMGYASEVGLPFELGIIRNHYIGRTFIEPTDQIRSMGVKLKHNANASVLAGKRVILIDDSIVRGTTSKKIVAMVREAGAKEVHLRIASPPTSYSCFYGVDTPERSHLIAAQYSLEEMCKKIGADSLAFISIDGLYRAVHQAKRDPASPAYCDACFTGDYPAPLVDQVENCVSQSPLFSQTS